MNDILEFIDDLKELHVLYKQGDIRDFDFANKIQKYERQVEEFERAMDAQHQLFFKDTPFMQYQPQREV